jgi:hypothetical protein
MRLGAGGGAAAAMRGRMTKKIALLLLGVFGCVDESPDENLGDVESEIRDTSQPAFAGNMSGVVSVNSATGLCSGSQVSADTVITAAHCAPNGATVWVAFQPWLFPGTSPVTLDAPGTRKVRGTLYRHPNYDSSNKYHDIAVVKLVAGGPVQTKPLVVGQTPLRSNRTAYVAGFGKSNGSCTGPTKTLYWDSAVIDLWYPAGVSPPQRYDLDGEYACDGDSGGPIFGDPVVDPWIVDGVYSGGWRGFPFTSRWDVYIPTSTHYAWIKNQVCPTLRRNSLLSYVGDLCHYSAGNRILWRATDGGVAMWNLDDNGVIVSEPWFAAAAEDKVQGTGDFDGDGDADIAVRGNNGQIKIWYMQGNSVASTAYYGGLDPSWWWKVVGVGDFDGDGTADLLWRDEGTPVGSGTGRLAIWKSGKNTTVWYPSWYNTNNPPSLDWKVKAVADFNNDGFADIFWQQAATPQNPNQQTSIWLMNGSSMWGEWLPGPSGGKTFKGVGDFNGDGASDVMWMTSDRRLETWFSGGGTGASNIPELGTTEAVEKQLRGPSYYNTFEQSGVPAAVTPGYDIVGIGDFNHDGRDDLLWQGGNYYSLWLLDGVRNYLSVPLRSANESARYVTSNWSVKGLMRNN